MSTKDWGDLASGNEVHPKDTPSSQLPLLGSSALAHPGTRPHTMNAIKRVHQERQRRPRVPALFSTEASPLPHLRPPLRAKRCTAHPQNRSQPKPRPIHSYPNRQWHRINLAPPDPGPALCRTVQGGTWRSCDGTEKPHPSPTNPTRTAMAEEVKIATSRKWPETSALNTDKKGKRLSNPVGLDILKSYLTTYTGNLPAATHLPHPSCRLP